MQAKSASQTAALLEEAKLNAGPVTYAKAHGYKIEFAHTTVRNQPMTLIGIKHDSAHDTKGMQRFLAAGELTKTQAVKSVLIIIRAQEAEAVETN